MYEILLAVNAILYGLVAFWYATRRCASAFHPGAMYLVIHGFIFVFRPIVARIEGYRLVYDLYRFMPSPEVKLVTIGITMLTLIVVMGTLVRFASEPPRFEPTPDDIRDRMKVPTLVIALTLGLVATWSAVTNVNAIAYDLNTMKITASGYRINTTGSGYFNEAQQMLVPITLMIAWVFRFRLIALLPFVGFVLLKSSSGGRGPFVIAIAAMALLYLYERRRNWPTPRVAVISLVSLALFITVGQDRGYALRSFFIPDQAVKASQFERQDLSQGVLGGMDYANMEYVEYIVNTVPRRTHTYSYFVENLQILTEPIPRALWPGKPVGPPIKMFDLFDYGNPWGITISVAGQGWQGLGWLGVALYSFLAGAFLAGIYRFAMRRIGSPFILIAYLNFVGGLVLYIRDGGLITVMRSEVFYIAPLVAAYALAGNVRLRLRLLDSLGPEKYREVMARLGTARRAGGGTAHGATRRIQAARTDGQPA